MRIGRSRSSKVVDFGTNRKGVFLLVISSNFGPILHRFWDTASYWLKIANSSYPTLVWRPRSGGTRQNFWMKLTAQKLEGWGYYMVKIAWSWIRPFLHESPVWQTDRQTDGRTDRRNCDSICALSIYAVARKKHLERQVNSLNAAARQRCRLLLTDRQTDHATVTVAIGGITFSE